MFLTSPYIDQALAQAYAVCSPFRVSMNGFLVVEAAQATVLQFARMAQQVSLPLGYE